MLRGGRVKRVNMASPCQISWQSVKPLPRYGDFWHPFVKRFALRYQTVICLRCPVLSVCLSVTMKLGTQVGLGPGHIVRWVFGNLGAVPQRGTAPNWGTAPKLSAYICCGQMAGWIKMPLGKKVDLDPSNIVLDADLAPPAPSLNFRPMSDVAKRLNGSKCHLEWG